MSSGDPARRTRGWWPLLLPLAFLVHLAEEWWGGPGFVSWTESALGRRVSPLRFLVINGVAWPVFAALTVAAVRRRGLAWFITAFATLIAVNGVLHLLATLYSGSYSPGTVSGLLLYLPIGAAAVAAGARELDRPTFARAVATGFAIHALVPLVAFW